MAAFVVSFRCISMQGCSGLLYVYQERIVIILAVLSVFGAISADGDRELSLSFAFP